MTINQETEYNLTEAEIKEAISEWMYEKHNVAGIKPIDIHFDCEFNSRECPVNFSAQIKTERKL